MIYRMTVFLNISFPRKFVRELKGNENVNMTAQMDIKD